MDASTKEDSSPKAVAALDVEQQRTDVQEQEYDDDLAILGASDQEQWMRYARLVSYVSIAFTLVGGLAGIVLSFLTDSVSLLGYGLESFVDVWSSVLVLWRFWKTDVNVQHKQMAFNKREQSASLGIAITFVLIGLFVAIQALIHIAHHEKEVDAEILLAISGVSVVFLAVLAAIKFRIAKALNSPSLYKDGISSVTVALLSVGILLSTVVYDIDSSVWWLDDVVALLISAFLIAYGTVSIYDHRRFR